MKQIKKQEPQENEKNKKSGPENTNRTLKLSISQKKLKNSTQQQGRQQISSYQKQIICHNSPLQCGQQEPQENEKNKKSGPENTNRTLKLSISQKKLKNSTQQQGQQQISSYQKINHLPQQSAMWSTATQRQ
eukprot:TRINITY_DN10861_c0_g1_i5.p5 TRINITY_DN10861_c0_g1~~TRINITY_DN10861_c0_g1_i5.p5  ORF type:complete len:132 (+),score=6.29 TRINITY_DN10861_c0_g1_i5:987-1382(+)